MLVNGREIDAAGMTLLEFLRTNGYQEMRVAVEKNGEIVPRSRYAEELLCDEDRIEIVSFVGGG